MNANFWHYPRTELAEQVLGMFKVGLSHALIFFAPRRMGKTEFLLKDVMPLAEKQGWKTFYFSFLDVGPRADAEFTQALLAFAKEVGGVVAKSDSILQRISKIGGEAIGIKANVELHTTPGQPQKNMKAIIASLAKQHKVLFLMDEVQVLALNEANQDFVAALRTALDVHKDTVKVIFTGSSREGLRRLFSQAGAPFFHFGQNLPFPELDRGFTDHLAFAFERATRRKLDRDVLWLKFQEMEKVPQLARLLVERLALNPMLTIEEANDQLLTELFDDRAFVEIWEACSKLERLLLQEIALGTNTLFSKETRHALATKLGLTRLPVPSVQSSLRVLQRKQLIGKLPERGAYFIDDPNFRGWLLERFC